jgi:hypothetical protein
MTRPVSLSLALVLALGAANARAQAEYFYLLPQYWMTQWGQVIMMPMVVPQMLLMAPQAAQAPVVPQMPQMLPVSPDIAAMMASLLVPSSENQTWPPPLAPVPFQAVPEEPPEAVQSGMGVLGTGGDPGASKQLDIPAVPSIQPESAPVRRPDEGIVETPLSSMETKALPDAKPVVTSGAEAARKPKPRVKPKSATSAETSKPRRLCWSNGVVDACPK